MVQPFFWFDGVKCMRTQVVSAWPISARRSSTNALNETRHGLCVKGVCARKRHQARQNDNRAVCRLHIGDHF